MASKFDPKLYQDIAITDLILFSLYSVLSKQQQCSFERLVKECFDLFPQNFALSDHPQWPDSRKLDRALRTLREQNLIQGDPQSGFELTKPGQKQGLEVEKLLKQKKLEW